MRLDRKRMPCQRQYLQPNLGWERRKTYQNKSRLNECGRFRRNDMQNDDKALDGQLRRKEDCQMVRLQDGHLQRYHKTLAHASSSWALTKMKAHLPLDLDKLELDHLNITMSMSNGEDWAKRIRLDKNGQHWWHCGAYRGQLYKVSSMRIDNVPQTAHVQRTTYRMDKNMGDFADSYRMDKRMADLADLLLCAQRQTSKD